MFTVGDAVEGFLRYLFPEKMEELDKLSKGVSLAEAFDEYVEEECTPSLPDLPVSEPL